MCPVGISEWEELANQFHRLFFQNNFYVPTLSWGTEHSLKLQIRQLLRTAESNLRKERSKAASPQLFFAHRLAIRVHHQYSQYVFHLSRILRY